MSQHQYGASQNSQQTETPAYQTPTPMYCAQLAKQVLPT